jgi:hypothetical protein
MLRPYTLLVNRVDIKKLVLLNLIPDNLIMVLNYTSAV